MKRSVATLVIAGVVLATLAGCTRHRPSDKPPVHLNPNMDMQPRYNPQAESKFFEDGATMRQPVPGTVARGWLHDDAAYYTGLTDNGDTVRTNPVPVTLELLKHGEERFNIYCSPCHSRVGDGKGIVTQRGYIPPPTFHQERLLKERDGHFFLVMTNGIRNMPTYRYQVPVADRWAIVAYIRALQRAQNASLNDVPTEMQKNLTK